MADFSDEFTEASDTLLKNHTPNVGTAWVWTGDGIGGGDDSFQVGGGDGYTESNVIGSMEKGRDLVSPELGTPDHQVWGQRSGFTPNSSIFMAVRVVDANNFYGYRLAGTGGLGRRLTRYVSATPVDLVSSQGVTGEWIKVKAEGTTLSFWQGGTGSEPSDPESDTNWTQIGVDQTGQTNHQTEESCGLVLIVGSSATPFLQSFRASAIGGGAGDSVIEVNLPLLGVG